MIDGKYEFSDLENATTHDFIDISSEEWREYVFQEEEWDGELMVKSYEIREPVALAIGESGHRIFDADGCSHYVPYGWMGIQWRAKEGHPHFVR